MSDTQELFAALPTTQRMSDTLQLVVTCQTLNLPETRQQMSDMLQLVVDSREIQLTSQVVASPTQRQAEAYRTFVDAFLLA